MNIFLTTTCLLISMASFSQTLSPGMEAPEMQVDTWVKGAPVNTFHKDSNYVIEFWATWCGPCKESIPRLTKMAREYPQTTFIGVAIAEADTKDVAPFVNKMGEKMEYHVAIDKQQSATAREGYMSRHWLEAAGLRMIPATFVISNNKVIWIGHPAQLEDVLKKIKANRWDTNAFARKWKKSKKQ